MFNFCKYFTVRSYKMKKYRFCRFKKQIISTECTKCKFKEPQEYKPLKKKSSKLKKAEDNRFSIFTEDFEHCYACHQKPRYGEKLDMHEVWGGSNRQRCMKNGLCVPLCRSCHSNEDTINNLRIKLQKEYEKQGHSREDFISLIGMSYLKKGL